MWIVSTIELRTCNDDRRFIRRRPSPLCNKSDGAFLASSSSVPHHVALEEPPCRTCSTKRRYHTRSMRSLTAPLGSPTC